MTPQERCVQWTASACKQCRMLAVSKHLGASWLWSSRLCMLTGIGLEGSNDTAIFTSPTWSVDASFKANSYNLQHPADEIVSRTSPKTILITAANS